jgi:hypothetical protein
MNPSPVEGGQRRFRRHRHTGGFAGHGGKGEGGVDLRSATSDSFGRETVVRCFSDAGPSG